MQVSKGRKKKANASPRRCCSVNIIFIVVLL